MADKKMTTRDILNWILDNSSDTDSMDKISALTYPYTSRYLEKFNNPKDEGYYPGQD